PGASGPAVGATGPGWARSREPVRVETGDGGADGTLADLFQTVRFRAARAGVLGATETLKELRLRLPGDDQGRVGTKQGLIMVEGFDEMDIDDLWGREIGRASCRERVEIVGVAGRMRENKK